ncbi:mycothiol-dependent nitroreductase Rv2466c family protein [Microlunatus parietis]|uniref:2-hydroxychromene-2-carboxylate isomerase n=1 Tax=Microlunatus parietis TaxID=682979 RepID=A0A7Y9LF36_9ACTN|nr:disulfide bond formation protein DsbA [Microlunatus parietis]NYE75662.1 2-hydroxychromene-2-carboxylate isomerase [Microlunatus parietis]
MTKDGWRVDCWFDPSCPLTWLTARWLLRLAERELITVDWHLMSLSVLNEGRADDPEGDPDGYLWVPVRICAAVLDRHGPAALLRFYRALWEREPGVENDWLNDFVEALGTAGLPADLVRAGESAAFDAAIRASHARGVALVGPGLGTPVVRLRDRSGVDRAFFGPVITAEVGDEDGLRLWRAMIELAAVTPFTELKTPGLT